MEVKNMMPALVILAQVIFIFLMLGKVCCDWEAVNWFLFVLAFVTYPIMQLACLVGKRCLNVLNRGDSVLSHQSAPLKQHL